MKRTILTAKPTLRESLAPNKHPLVDVSSEPFDTTAPISNAPEKPTVVHVKESFDKEFVKDDFNSGRWYSYTIFKLHKDGHSVADIQAILKAVVPDREPWTKYIKDVEKRLNSTPTKKMEPTPTQSPFTITVELGPATMKQLSDLIRRMK